MKQRNDPASRVRIRRWLPISKAPTMRSTVRNCHILEHEEMGMMRNFRIRA